MTSYIARLLQRLKYITHRLGHILTLVASLGLWIGIYTVIDGTVSSERGTEQTMVASPRPDTLPEQSESTFTISDSSNLI